VTLLVLFTLSAQAAVVVVAGVEVVESLSMWAVGATAIAALAVSWVMMSRVESRPPAALGLVPARRGLIDFGRGAVVGLVLVGTTCAVLGTAGWLPLAEALRAGIGRPEEMLYVTGVLLLAAFFEELVLRGYPFQVLSEAYGPAVAVGVTALVFGALHGANPGVGWTALVNTVLAGILLGIMYWRTFSLWLVTGAHLAWNWTMGVMVGLPVSGLDVDGSRSVIQVGGPDIITGGEYGPEGGLLLGLVTLMGVLWMAKTPHLTRDPAVLALAPLPADRIRRSQGVEVQAGS
jgi:membrane protease YdiL (CAAX protease family)